jgi:hypothetical protein
MTELTYTVNLGADEITLLMQLLNQHFAKVQRKQRAQGVEPSTPFAVQLMQKLASARDAGIRAARAAGRL